MTKTFCNACKQEITDNQRDQSNMVAKEWLAKMGERYGLTVQTDGEVDTFCPTHLPFAEDYWFDKVTAMERLHKQASSTLRNHCKDYFKGLNDDTGIPRADRKIATGPSDQGAASRLG